MSDGKSFASMMNDYRVYRVKRGDTLWSIARKELKDAERWRELAKLNRIAESTTKPGLYLIYPNEPLLLPKSDGESPETSLLSKASRIDSEQNQCRIDGKGADSGQLFLTTRPQGYRPAQPRGKEEPAAPPGPKGNPDREPELIAPPVVKVRFAGVKQKVFEQLAAQVIGPGFKAELFVSGEMKIQAQGDIEFWSDLKNGAIEYEKKVKLFGAESAVSLLYGFEIQGISTNSTSTPSFKLTIFGVETPLGTSKISIEAPNVLIYEFSVERQGSANGVDYVMELACELKVTILPAEQLQKIGKFVTVTKESLETAVYIGYGVLLAAAAAKGMATLLQVTEVVLTRATSMFLIIVITPEMERQLNGGSPYGGPQSI